MRLIIATTFIIFAFTYNSFAQINTQVKPLEINKTESKLLIPNVFSPNNDGVNDQFKIVNVGQIQIMEFRIFNRWGTLVFRAEGELASKGWDGNYKGSAQAQGTYGYLITVKDENGERASYKGTVTLIR